MTYHYEEWKPVVGFEEFYEVSSEGRVRTLQARGRHPAGLVLKPETKGAGYQSTTLTGRIVKARPIHQLVAEAFIGPRPSGHQVNHIDGDKKNNTAPNLEYLTPKENIRHSIETGLRWRAAKGRPRISKEQVIEIRSMLPSDSNKEMAARLGLHVKSVARIRRGVSWKGVGDADLPPIRRPGRPFIHRYDQPS